jgi:hypothetical protein
MAYLQKKGKKTKLIQIAQMFRDKLEAEGNHDFIINLIDEELKLNGVVII